ncbi:hypothetical protein TBR22_A06250 [Luteitalea sp. TBR-22]|nr:hypothetical protein TBR22_A06250 [Luteitalea sp. TBR-22]
MTTPYAKYPLLVLRHMLHPFPGLLRGTARLVGWTGLAAVSLLAAMLRAPTGNRRRRRSGLGIMARDHNGRPIKGRKY